MDLSVVIPVHNSRDTLDPLLARLLPVLRGIADSYEVLLVDDGSRDDSWSEIDRLGRVYPGVVTGIRLMRNFGQHNALMCGMRHAQGEYVATMDDDLQNPPEELPKLLAAARAENLDVVYGLPARREHALHRNLGSSLVNAFFRLVFRTSIPTGPFRVLHRDVVRAILSYTLNFTYIDGLLAWNTQRVGAVEVEHHARQAGRSGYSFGKLVALALNLFTNFSLLPLQLVSFLGIATAGAGFVAGFCLLVLHFAGRIVVQGYASTIVAVLVLGGVQLLALGIMGEYLGRLHLNMNRKPQYTIRGTTADRRASQGDGSPASPTEAASNTSRSARAEDVPS